jgi:hypothetical protein
MSTSAAEIDERVSDVRVLDDRLEVDLRDGRRIAAPLAWFPRLAAASQEQRGRWEVSGGGYGVHWPELDEDIGVAGLLRASA